MPVLKDAAARPRPTGCTPSHRGPITEEAALDRGAEPPTPTVDHGTLKLVLVEADELVLAGLASLLDHEADFAVAATATTVAGALEATTSSAADVIVLDPDLRAHDGLDLLEQLPTDRQRPRTLAFTATDDPEALRRALAGGIDGYILKQAGHHALADAIRRTAQGQTVISPEFVFRLIDQPRASDNPPSAALTDREQQVLEHISAGASNAQIAASLHVSQRTAQKHTENLFTKLGAGNRAEVVAEGFRHRLLR